MTLISNVIIINIFLDRDRNHWVFVILCNPGGDFESYPDCPTMIMFNSLDGSNIENIEKEIKRLFFLSC